ncbi:glucosaminidase domain-containing protein [Paenibacillus yanchengensis]|uniref:Glucosaminidase domain-containing protein n=1 Tax=Paenibacillus yanchengensis TaxID=2035833 RepID=A0ABW4YQ28_9BACL
MKMMKHMLGITMIITLFVLLLPTVTVHLQAQASTEEENKGSATRVISTYHINQNKPMINSLYKIPRDFIDFDHYAKQATAISDPEAILQYLQTKETIQVHTKFKLKKRNMLLSSPPSEAKITRLHREIVKEQPIPLEEEIETVISTPIKKLFEVTAYFLNIRAEHHANSDILSTVKQGTILEVQSILENGWLKLTGGGFVSGKYTKPLEISEQESIIADKDKLEITPELDTDRKQQSAVTVQEKADIQPKNTTKPTNAVQQLSGLDAEQVEQLFGGSLLSGHDLGTAVMEMEEEYGINAFFTVAVMKLESGHGKSNLAQKKNNLFGLNAIDGQAFKKGYSFKTKGESVEKFAQLISKNYVNKGLTTIEKIAGKYCPTDDRWPGLVKSIMKSDFKKLT